MKVVYKTLPSEQEVVIHCDYCNARIWQVRGDLVDSHLLGASGALCLCEECVNKYVLGEVCQENEPLF